VAGCSRAGHEPGSSLAFSLFLNPAHKFGGTKDPPEFGERMVRSERLRQGLNVGDVQSALGNTPLKCRVGVPSGPAHELWRCEFPARLFL
jgi:hypothetical protein